MQFHVCLLEGCFPHEGDFPLRARPIFDSSKLSQKVEIPGLRDRNTAKAFPSL